MFAQRTSAVSPSCAKTRPASMGPRSHERGNPFPARRFRGELTSVTLPVLQWGRVLMNAETVGRDRSADADFACFNGAAFS